MKNKSFWMGLSISLILILVYQFIPSKADKKQLTEPFVLSLWDIGFVPSVSSNVINDFTFNMMKIDSEEATLMPVQFSSFIGRPIILHFWATWCGPCVEELPSYDQFCKDSKVVNIAICSGKTPPLEVLKFCQPKGIKNVQLSIDKNSLIMGRFRADGLPTSLFIDTKGREIGRIVGPVQWGNPEISKLIENLLLSRF